MTTTFRPLSSFCWETGKGKTFPASAAGAAPARLASASRPQSSTAILRTCTFVNLLSVREL
jgi:hypothetical protein